MKSKRTWLIPLIICMVLLACNLPQSLAPTEELEQKEVEEIEEIEEPDEAGETEESVGQIEDPVEDPVEESEPDFPPIALSCPESVSGKLIMNHSWTFSPAEDEVISIDGSTDGDMAWCVISIEGETVIFDECEFSFSNSGTIKTDAGDCTVTGEGVAAIEVTGSCQDGVVTLEISEFSEGDLGNTMTCPNISQPYPTFFPPSILDFDFLLTPSGDTWTHYGMIDMSFNYTKAWTLLLPDSYFDMP